MWRENANTSVSISLPWKQVSISMSPHKPFVDSRLQYRVNFISMLRRGALFIAVDWDVLWKAYERLEPLFLLSVTRTCMLHIDPSPTAEVTSFYSVQRGRCFIWSGFVSWEKKSCELVLAWIFTVAINFRREIRNVMFSKREGGREIGHKLDAVRTRQKEGEGWSQ